MPLRGSASNIAKASLQLHKHPMHQRYQMEKMIHGAPLKPGSLKTRQPYEADARLSRGRPSIFDPASSLKRKIKSPETARSVESGLKSGVKFWYGETPKEYATGEVIGYALGAALGGGYKVAKGVYQGGKSIYKALKHADSMVPGNRPPRPKTPSAPNPTNVEGRRNLLKGGALAVTGGAVAKMSGATDALVAGVNKLRGGKIAAKVFVPKSFPNIHGFNWERMASSSNVTRKELRSVHPDLEDFSPRKGTPPWTGLSSASDYLGEQIADTMPDEFYEKIVARNIKALENPQKYNEIKDHMKKIEEGFGVDSIEMLHPLNVKDAKRKFERDAIFASRRHFDRQIENKYRNHYKQQARKMKEKWGTGHEVSVDHSIETYFTSGDAHNLGNLVDDDFMFRADKKTAEEIKKYLLNEKKWQAFRYSQNKAPFV